MFKNCKTGQEGGTRRVFVAVVLALVAIPQVSGRAADPGVKKVTVYQSGSGGYHTYRIPAIAVTRQGTLLAFCEGRKGSQSDSGNIDLLLRRSTDHGQTWLPVETVVDDGNQTCGNPCPIVDRRTGVVVLLFCKNRGSDNEGQVLRGEVPPRSVWVTVSRDDGVTWSKPVEISSQVRKPNWRWYATGPCHGIQLADGRLVAPCDHSTSNDDKGLHSHVIFSDDAGATWKLGGVQPGHTDESTVVELNDGALYLNVRNYRPAHRRAFSFSHDRGTTWSPLDDDPALIEPRCQGSVLSLSTQKSAGRNRVLFSNPASDKRENLTVRLSYDECKTWPVAKAVWPGPAAYSDLVVAADGSIGCLFECGMARPVPDNHAGVIFAGMADRRSGPHPAAKLNLRLGRAGDITEVRLTIPA